MKLITPVFNFLNSALYSVYLKQSLNDDRLGGGAMKLSHGGYTCTAWSCELFMDEDNASYYKKSRSMSR